jgi:tripartite-type tricarboxylate transporter receptor subunit TctC
LPPRLGILAGQAAPKNRAAGEEVMRALRRRFAVLAVAALAAAAAQNANAQAAYPSKPVRVIVPFAPGGATDTIARLIAQQLAISLRQQFNVENHGGAGGNIGMGMAAGTPPDGHMILTVSSSYYLNPSLHAKIPYSPEKDFAPVSLVATSPYLLTVHPSMPAKTLMELVALLKANPGKYSYASPGRGTPGHLAAELFRLPRGLDVTHVPFKGGNPAITSTVAGHTPISFSSLPTAAPHVKAGTLRALAVLSAKRSPVLPDVPTTAEAGIPGLEVEIISGMLVRAGTPRTNIDLLYREIAKAVALPEVAKRMTALGFTPVANTPAEFDAWLKVELPKWRKVVRDAKM